MADYALEYWIGTTKVREYRTASSKEDAAVIAVGDVVTLEEIYNEDLANTNDLEVSG